MRKRLGGRKPGLFPGRSLNQGERDLLTSAMADVTPLARPTSVAPALTPLPGARFRPRLSFMEEAPVSVEAPAADRSINGMDGAKRRRLVRGELPVEARLDLHGLTREVAHRALDRFITEAHAAGQRCVLVITGLGRASLIGETPTGVLRDALPRWLNASAHTHKVMGWHPATRQDGGDGAFYVLLRRGR